MAHVDNLRRHFPALRHTTYLNTATCGALPDVVVQKMQDTLNRQFEEGRLRSTYFEAVKQVKQEIREQLAILLDARADEFALTNGTTQALNTVLWGLPLQPGDEIVYMSTQHPGGLVPIALQKQRRGAVLRCVPGTGTKDALLSGLERVLSARTRLVVAPHVCHQTGQRMPVEEIAALAHQHGAYCLIDGAQGAGADALSLAGSNIDFYALPGQKWLCGPDATGALYVRKDLHATLDLTYAGLASLASESAHDESGCFLPTSTSAKYEFVQADLLNLAGFLESLKFMRIQVGWEYAMTRIRGLSGHLFEALLDIPRVSIVTPRDARAGIVSFRINGMTSKAFAAEAKERQIDLRTVAQGEWVRVSTGFYNTEDEIARVVQLATQ